MKYRNCISIDISQNLFKLLDYNSKKSNSLNILLAISGGVDSVFLLNILDKIKFTNNISISLAHVNYNGPSSNDMERMSKDLAKHFNCKIYIKNVIIKKNVNFESAARKIRYDFFQKIIKDNSLDYIMTAHHNLDQIETLYMKYQDNSDWISMIGIREKRNNIIRPILNIKKKQIDKYMENNKIKFIYDISNDNLFIRRNHIRKTIIPRLLKKNPTLIKKLLSNSNLYNRKLIDLNKRILNIISNKIIFNNNSIALNKSFISDLSVIETKLLIQTIINNIFFINVYYSKIFWINLHDFILSSKSGKKIIISNSIKILNDRDLFFIIKDNIETSKKVRIIDKLNWKDNIFSICKIDKHPEDVSRNKIIIDRSIINSGIYVREWSKGDRMITNDGINRKVKKLLINNKIPVAYKKSIPIVVNSDNKILWIPLIAYGKNLINNNKLAMIRCDNGF